MEDQLSRGERTPRPEHLETLRLLRKYPSVQRLFGFPKPVTLGDIQQLHDQFSLEADSLYLLTKNEGNFLTEQDWQEAKTKVKALNPPRFNFDPVTPPQPEPSDVTFRFLGSPNFWPGELRHGECVAFIQHTAVGTQASVRSTFGNPASEVSAHGCVALDGSVDLFVGFYDAAWANGIVESGALWELIALFNGWNPNQRTVSLEREDGGDPKLPVSDAQFRGAIAFWRRALAAHPETEVLSGHNAISPKSRSCPASAWLDSGLLRELASTLGLSYLEY